MLCNQVPSLACSTSVVSSHFIATSSSLHQTHLSVKSHRLKRKSHRLSRKPSWYAAALPARPYPCPCLTPVLRCLAQRIFMSIYQSSTKVLEVKEEAVQPCTKEKDYPSAEDRTADNRTTPLTQPRRLRVARRRRMVHLQTALFLMLVHCCFPPLGHCRTYSLRRCVFST